VKFKLRRFFSGKPFTISVADSSFFQPGDRLWYGDTPLRILAVGSNTLSVVRALTFKQRIVRWLIKVLEWSPRQQVLGRLYQTQEEEPGQEQSRYGRPAGRYSRRPRT